jgi:multiple antibiotic resistance protein
VWDEVLKFFVLFFVVVEPVTLVPLFAAMTEGEDEPFRRRMALKAVCIAGIVLFLFAVGGAAFLKVMGISIDAFRIAGGIMLFLIALEMVFARESGTRVTPDEKDEGRKRKDVSVFPLAFPFIAGPGALAIVLLTFGAARDDVRLSVGLFGAVIAVLAITYGLMRLTPIVMRVMGVTGGNVVNRLSGVVLAALAVQFIITGITNVFQGAGP